MLETIAAVNQAVNNFVWGVPAMVCIIGVGLLLSVRTGFLQIRKFPYVIKTTIGRMFRKKDASDGAMTPFQAVCTALAGTVGTGNIAGVAGAIAIGGPGAVFWMWCSALLGMCTKFAEVTLAVHFRERNAAGAELTISGFTTTYGGWASIFTAVALCCFAFSTIIGWGLYGSRFLAFLCHNDKVVRPFFVVYSFVSILGATVDLGLLWSVADTFNGLMSIPNLIALLLLSGTVVNLTKEFFASEKANG